MVEERTDGSVIVELSFAGVDWLVREILREAGDAAVLEPEDAREAVRAAVARLREANACSRRRLGLHLGYNCRMAIEVASRELRNNTAELLRRVGAGEQIVVTTRGKPVASLIPFESPRRRWLSRAERTTPQPDTGRPRPARGPRPLGR